MDFYVLMHWIGRQELDEALAHFKTRTHVLRLVQVLLRITKDAYENVFSYTVLPPKAQAASRDNPL